jgi:hypothetical protein
MIFRTLAIMFIRTGVRDEVMPLHGERLLKSDGSHENRET